MTMKSFTSILLLLGPLMVHASELEPKSLPPAQSDSDAALNQVVSRACYEQKVTAFRLENGEETIITHDQIIEWKDECGATSE